MLVAGHDSLRTARAAEGLRARQARVADAAPEAVLISREPPGDPNLLDALVAALAAAPGS